VSRTLVTGNGKTIGEMVTETHTASAVDGKPFTQHGEVDMA
jgi:hypothetical protein